MSIGIINKCHKYAYTSAYNLLVEKNAPGFRYIDEKFYSSENETRNYKYAEYAQQSNKTSAADPQVPNPPIIQKNHEALEAKEDYDFENDYDSEEASEITTTPNPQIEPPHITKIRYQAEKISEPLFYSHLPTQTIGALKPISDMSKDLVDTFKPYKSAYYAKRDLLQPLRGIGNIFKGLVTFIAAPIFLIIFNIYSIFIFPILVCITPPKYHYNNLGILRFIKETIINVIKNVIRNFYTSLTWVLLESPLSIIRGTTQVATFPLTYLRVIIRGIGTWIFGAPLIENNKGTKKLVALLAKSIELNDDLSAQYCIHKLHEKYGKGLDRNQKTNIIKKDELNLYLEITQSINPTEEQRRAYIKLFIVQSERTSLL